MRNDWDLTAVEAATLYRIDEEAGEAELYVKRDGFDVGGLVPVEPCEHGAIERHPVYADDAVEGDDGFEWSIFEKWCDGAALKEHGAAYCDDKACCDNYGDLPTKEGT